MTTHTQERVSHKEQWEQILAVLRNTVKKSDFLTWFSQTALLDIVEGVLHIGVPSDFYLQAIQARSELIIDAAAQCTFPQGPITQVSVRIDGSIHKKDERLVSLDKLDQKITKQTRENNTVTLVEGISSKLLNPSYTLDKFIVGPANQLAYAAAQAVAAQPGTSYNPLFIYGDVGLGKTHLLQAIGNAVLKKNRKTPIVYSTSERFVNEVVDAIRRQQTSQLRSKYRNIDVLIIDDIQFLANKDQTQIEFFHTFNALYEAGKQIILSSDRPPKELTQLESRLCSRFESGMIVDMQMPDYETRLAILQAKCQERGFFLSPEVAEFIAHHTTSSIRELEGILNQTIAQYELVQRPPTIQSVGAFLQKLNRAIDVRKYHSHLEARPKAQSEDEVIDCISNYYKVETVALMGSSRKKEIAVPRQVAMYLCKTELGRTYERIGELFNGRLHSTVMHAVSKIKDEMQQDSKLTRDIHIIKEELGFL